MSLGYKQEYFPSSVFGNMTLDVSGDPISIAVTTQATSTTTGALIIAGGVGVAKDVHVGGNAVVCGATKTLGFFGTAGTTKPAVTVNTTAATATCASLLTALTGMGLLTTVATS